VQADDETLKPSLFHDGIGSPVKLTTITKIAKKPHETKLNHKVKCKIKYIADFSWQKDKMIHFPITKFYLSSIIYKCRRTKYYLVGF